MKNKDLKKPLQTINQSPDKQQGSFIDFNQNFSKTVSNQDNYNTNENLQNNSNKQRRLISLPQSCTDDIDLVVEQMKKAKYSMIQKMKQDGCTQQFIQQMCNQIQSLCEQTWLDFTSIVQFKKNITRKQKAPIKIKLNDNIKNSNDIGMNLLQLAIKRNCQFKQEQVQFQFNPQQKLGGYIPTITNVKQNNVIQHINESEFIEIVSKNRLQDSKDRVKGFEQYTAQLQINFKKLIPIIQRDRHKLRKQLQFPPNYVLDARAINVINSKSQSNVKGFRTISRRKPL